MVVGGATVISACTWLILLVTTLAMIGYALGNYLAILTGRLGQLLVS